VACEGQKHHISSIVSSQQWLQKLKGIVHGQIEDYRPRRQKSSDGIIVKKGRMILGQ
jgi:hypothetical protein